MAMKIEGPDTRRESLEAFAEKHDLTMKITKRSRIAIEKRILARYIASFKDAEVKDLGMLISEYGEGDTVDEAIENYAEKISGRILVIGAYTPERREIPVPFLERPHDP